VVRLSLPVSAVTTGGADALETGWVAEAGTLSRQQHRVVRIEEVRS